MKLFCYFFFLRLFPFLRAANDSLTACRVWLLLGGKAAVGKHFLLKIFDFRSIKKIFRGPK